MSLGARASALSLRFQPLYREIPALPVDLFRIAVGLLGFAYFVSLILDVPDFSGSQGIVDHALSFETFWFTRISLFQTGLPDAFFYGVYGLGAAVCVAGLVAGYRPRVLSVFLFLVAVSTYRWNFIVMFVDDVVMHLLFFWMMLLPSGRTLVWADWRRDGSDVLARWATATVPGFTVRALIFNVSLVYVVAGLTKFTSPMWLEGTALYATLKTPVSRFPELWGVEHLPLLRVFDYLALAAEPVIPLLLLWRRPSWVKWLGLLVQQGFHAGIVATLEIPFANLALAGSAVLFFHREIAAAAAQRVGTSLPTLASVPPAWRDRFALGTMGVLVCACLYKVPLLKVLVPPAYVLLFTIGLVQNYHLFNWIDDRNYSIAYEATETRGGEKTAIEPESILPRGVRHVLAQIVVNGDVWLPVMTPESHRAFRASFQDRYAQRYCESVPDSGRIGVLARRHRMTPDNLDLKRFATVHLLRFQCRNGEAILVRGFGSRRNRAR